MRLLDFDVLLNQARLSLAAFDDRMWRDRLKSRLRELS